ncbi:uncharacterized protein LOC118745832 [Rhagoletis pomonella]|uniref:uncharacterized protein LOC118745832 n=1 Tax=Rhagoletis pomonella TaxID=28610 RepID=UPI00177EF96A|nr:uncharacterized protein LOC118745832 [Rhagoletis pomonella]
MGSLPADRLLAQRPFLVVGVDLCGPFYTSYRIRGKAPYKTYLAVFVCFSSKAVHAELISDLSTNNFVLSLKRFIGRRGIPYRIYCDNATNFVGAQAQLNELKRQFFNQQSVSDLEQFGSVHGFEFRFIPPRAPHFGGLWEAAIKSMKTLLVKYISQSNLTFEELQTVVIEVEAILNSRPLTPLTDDPNDGEALTPAHLLIGTSLKTLPEPQLNVIKESRLTSWQRITYLKQRLWDLWRRDYLHTLQVRSKWLEKQENIVPGQLVMIHDDNLPPQQWTLGRITNTSPGADGRVRVVDILTKRGTLRRPVHKIAPLPIE